MVQTDDAPAQLSQEEYETLAAFRYELRRFLQRSEQAARTVGLTPQQHQALLAIRASAQGAMTVGMLAEQLLVQPHSASDLADRLITLGLLSGDIAPEDRRRIWLRLTPEAVTRLNRLSNAHRAEVVKLRPTLNGLLRKLK
ncbi:MAG: MarR family transcriptional regulator [Sphingomonadales bacterium]|nr:MarR family transcriptional regulator [Sphingomonadales bacterium]MDE2171445.1 MarR family transcriptional regulator [Sphingomonadales bacterium]